MSFLASLNSHIGKLVLPGLQAKPYEFIAHRNFLATRLAVSLGALVAAPLCLAVGNAPTWWEAGALAWLLLPVAAVAIVSRTGNLAKGEAISIAAWIGLAVTMAIGSGSATGLGLLLIVPLEAVLASRQVSTFGMVAVAILAALGIPALATFGSPSSDRLIVGYGAGMTAAAELYAVVLALVATRLHRRRLREERLGHDRYQELTEVIDDVPLRLDRFGMVLQAGAAAQRLFGISAGDLAGRGLFEHVHVADRPAFLNLVAAAADAAESLSAVVRIRTATTLPSSKGAFREPVFAWAELRARRRTTERGDETSILCLMTDVSSRKRHEMALMETDEAARRTESARTLFLANVSHELRTPLNAIIGFADLLASEELGPREPAKQREYASIVMQSGHHLLAVVNTILDASKIEAGSFTILPEPFDLAGLIHGCCDMVGLKAQIGCVALSRDIAASMAKIVGDERAYKQILLNLLSNAIKFTPSGGRVSVSARPEGTSVIIAVADDGVGISPGDLPKLGVPFFQAQNAYDRAFEGTGLGLSVVRGLVGLHGGTMAIESAPGQGTRVAIRLPCDCRVHLKQGPSDTKIETIPRYVAPTQTIVGEGKFARIHKIA